MSRTHRHRPHWVQLNDPLEQNWYWFDQGLKWGWVKIPLHRTCNCRLCSRWKSWEVSPSRRDRHLAQRRVRDAVKGGDWE